MEGKKHHQLLQPIFFKTVKNYGSLECWGWDVTPSIKTCSLQNSEFIRKQGQPKEHKNIKSLIHYLSGMTLRGSLPGQNLGLSSVPRKVHSPSCPNRISSDHIGSNVFFF